MSRQPDLVTDSRLDTIFRGSTTIHTYREIDEAGSRFRRETWEQDGILGRGGFGIVSLQKCASAGAEQLRVVKMIRKPSRSAEYTRELEAVAKFSQRPYRPWFVQSLGWYENDDSLFITMEYCRLGDVQGYLDKHQLLPQSEVQTLSSQIVEGLAQMHRNGFAHRDLKPANILIKSKPPEQKWWVVLADFGISKRVDNCVELTTKLVGTLTFMAPELLGYLNRDGPDLLDSDRHPIHDFKAADMWAFGELIFRMLTGESTFRTPLELVRYCDGHEAFPSQRLPRSFDEHGRQFITSIMQISPQSRLSSAECTQHHWLHASIESDLNMLSMDQTIPSRPRNSGHLSATNASARWSRLSTQDDHRWIQPSQLNNVTQNMVELRSYTNGNDTSTHQTIKAVIASTSQAKMKPLMTLEHFNWIEMVVFSPDSKRLACLIGGSMICVWDTGSWTRLYVKKTQGYQVGHPPCPMTVKFSPDGRRLISKGALSVLYRDTETGKTLQKIEEPWMNLELNGFDSSYPSFDASPDGRYAAFCSGQDSNVQLREIIPGTVLELRSHGEIIRHVEFSPTGLQLLSISKDGEVRFWDVQTAKLIFVLDSHRQGDGSWCNLSSDGTLFIDYYCNEYSYVSSDREETCEYYRIWGTESGQLLFNTQNWVDSPSRHVFALSADNRQMACAAGKTHRAIQLRDVKSGKRLWTFKAPSQKQIQRASFSPEGELLAITLHDALGTAISTFMPQVALLDSRTGKLVQCLRHPSVLRRLKNFVREGVYGSCSMPYEQPQFSADGKYLVAALEGFDLQVWTRDEDTLARFGKSWF